MQPERSKLLPELSEQSKGDKARLVAGLLMTAEQGHFARLQWQAHLDAIDRERQYQELLRQWPRLANNLGVDIALAMGEAIQAVERFSAQVAQIDFSFLAEFENSDYQQAYKRSRTDLKQKQKQLRRNKGRHMSGAYYYK